MFRNDRGQILFLPGKLGMEGSFLFIDFDLPLVTLFKVGSTVGFSTLRHGRAVCINLCKVYLDVILVNDRPSKMDMNNMRRKKKLRY